MQEVLEVIKNLPEAGTFHSGGAADKTSIIKDKSISKDKDEKKTVQIEWQEPIDEKGLGKAGSQF